MFRVLPLLVLAACGSPPPMPGPADPVPLVLVSLDGFRREYLDRGITPALASLAADGVRADALVPVFPTKTFPNHYSMVTGLRPARHGIVGNVFTDPGLRAVFDMRNPAAVADARFWGGEPIWVTAERVGLRTATYFWPGSEAAIDGVRPSYWLPYEHEVPDTARVRQVLGWLALRGPARPGFVTLYLSLVDGAGHDHGPAAPETDSALARADRMVALLAGGLERIGGANLVIVSDHGMAATAPDRVVWLDDHVRREWLRTDELSPVLSAWPAPGLEDSVLAGLRGAPALAVYRRHELPERYGLQESPRMGDVVAVANEGWTIAWRPAPGEGETAIGGGDHGYDHDLSSMAGILVARGPGLRRGARVPALSSVHVHALLAALLRLRVPAGDASFDSVSAMLAPSATSGPDRRPASPRERGAPAPSSAGRARP